MSFKKLAATVATIVAVVCSSLPIGVAGSEASVGTREHPIPMGETGQFHDMEIRVTHYNPDAAAELRSRNDQNKPAGHGNTLILVKVELTYQGEDVERPDAYRYSFVGDSNAALPNVPCSTFGNTLHDEALRADLFPGGTSSFEICINAPKSALKGLEFYVSDVNGEMLFFALDPAFLASTPVASQP